MIRVGGVQTFFEGISAESYSMRELESESLPDDKDVVLRYCLLVLKWDV